jgi:inosine triphosphate pyrophosphatase
MVSFTLVTGNEHKLSEYKRLLPKDVDFSNVSVDLEEIQSFDSKAIVEHKVRQAFAMLNKPVIVEDVSAGLHALNGLPGPFIKFFEQRLGKDALYQLVAGDASATVSCTIGYYDGSKLLFFEGKVDGMIVPAIGDNGFGFDFCFKPNGQQKTFAQMEPAAKDSLSHRHLAVQELLKKLA